MLASCELRLYFLPYIYDELTNFQKKYMTLACHWLNESYIKFHGGNSDISPKIAKFGQAGPYFFAFGSEKLRIRTLFTPWEAHS